MIMADVVAVGEPGEIIARGPQVMPGYWKQPGETSNVLRDGWLYTGDIGKMDAEGYFSIVDRRKDMIDVSGFKVFPNEVEEVLASLPGVKECAVIGVPDAATGEAVKAFIVRGDPALDAGMVRDFCRARARELQSAKIHRIPRRICRSRTSAKFCARSCAKSRPRAPVNVRAKPAGDCAHQRKSRAPEMAPRAVTKVIASVYQTATKSGESSGQCVA